MIMPNVKMVSVYYQPCSGSLPLSSSSPVGRSTILQAAAVEYQSGALAAGVRRYFLFRETAVPCTFPKYLVDVRNWRLPALRTLQILLAVYRRLCTLLMSPYTALTPRTLFFQLLGKILVINIAGVA